MDFQLYKIKQQIWLRIFDAMHPRLKYNVQRSKLSLPLCCHCCQAAENNRAASNLAFTIRASINKTIFSQKAVYKSRAKSFTVFSNFMKRHPKLNSVARPLERQSKLENIYVYIRYIHKHAEWDTDISKKVPVTRWTMTVRKNIDAQNSYTDWICSVVVDGPIWSDGNGVNHLMKKQHWFQ